MSIDMKPLLPELIDALQADYKRPLNLVGQNALLKQLPKTAVQLCLVHRARHSLNFLGWKQRKEVAANLRQIYTAAT